MKHFKIEKNKPLRKKCGQENKMKKLRNRYWLCQMVLLLMLLFAFRESNPYVYYQLLRVFVAGFFGYWAYLAHIQSRRFSRNIFIGVAVIYNPIISWHLGRDIWEIVNTLTIIPIILSTCILRKTHA